MSDSLNFQFTLDGYKLILRCAKANYKFISYEKINYDEKFVIWRHDCDLSLNRAYKIAKIEQQENVRSTYFINPHSEFYNILEKHQTEIVKEILAMGHWIGLHFDADYFDIESESQLDEIIESEAILIWKYLGVKPSVFSFHNPSKFLLSCEDETYGGLINCYSKKFKNEIPYCSDSNGYWRHEDLYELMRNAEKPYMHVLTHPGWWQDESMPPRQRVFRSAFGRALKRIQEYDDALIGFKRDNIFGRSDVLKFLAESDADVYNLCDYLWNNKYLYVLLLILRKILENIILRVCKKIIMNSWNIREDDVIDFINEVLLEHSAVKLLDAISDLSMNKIPSINKQKYFIWEKQVCLWSDKLMNHGDQNIESSCADICENIEMLLKWENEYSLLDYKILSTKINVNIMQNDEVINGGKRGWDKSLAKFISEKI